MSISCDTITFFLLQIAALRELKSKNKQPSMLRFLKRLNCWCYLNLKIHDERRTQYTNGQKWREDEEKETPNQQMEWRGRRTSINMNLECKKENKSGGRWWWMVRVSRFYDDELNDLIECMYFVRMYEGIYISSSYL